MMRLLGVLVGSALAVAALVVFIGVPEFTTDDSVVDNSVITLPMRGELAAVVASEAAQPVADETVQDPEPVAASENTAAMSGPESLPEPEPVPEQEQEQEQEPEILAVATVDAINDMQQWYAFWSPFRSEIAASGFVDQLQKVTGLDYRVVKLKPGVYEVAFAYSDDNEITNNLSQITAATGLQLPEG
jgi:hypothetical protein